MGFARFEHRSRDSNAARAFYTAVLGAMPGVDFAPIPERAAARGVPAHWLGFLSVDDVVRRAGEVAARGGEQLGPIFPGPTAIARDPGGAIVALSGERSLERSPVGWHLLHTTDLARVLPFYAELAGLHANGTMTAGAQTFHLLADPLGAIADTAQLPGVHPHWLFYFTTRDFDAAREHGATLGAIVELPNGSRLVPCEDPLGGAFGLITAGL